MHEHHEEEMTPSALSYQLRDTIFPVIGFEFPVMAFLIPGYPALIFSQDIDYIGIFCQEWRIVPVNSRFDGNLGAVGLAPSA